MKKKTTRAKAAKPQLKKSKLDDEYKLLIGFLVTMIAGLILYIAFPEGKKPLEVKSEMCLMDRAYKFVKVYVVWEHGQTVWLQDLEPVERNQYYRLARPEGSYRTFDRERTIEFVQEHYTPVPCRKW